MFEKLFHYPTVLSRHLNAPFVRERENYLIHRARDGTAKATLLRIARELLIIIREMDLCSQQSISIKAIELAAEHWAKLQKHRNRACGLKHSRDLFVRTARDWLQFIGRLKQPKIKPAPYQSIIQDFSFLMEHDRALSAVTIKNYVWYVKLFLRWFNRKKRSLDDVSVLDVDMFVRQWQHKQNWSRVTCASCTKSLRAFFRYAERSKLCAHGIAEAIESPKIFKQETLPTGPGWDDIQKLLASTETNNPKDIRDRAILIFYFDIFFCLRISQ
jgi:integrase